MYRIVRKEKLNDNVTRMAIDAPCGRSRQCWSVHYVSRPRIRRKGPLTIAGVDREEGTVDIIFKLLERALVC